MLPRRENVIQIKADKYSDRIVRMYKYLEETKHEFVMSKQVLRSGTSISANVAESRNAQGPKDFISKLSIALKEADETEHWLKRLLTGDYITEKQFQSMYEDNEELIRILTKIIKTMKQKIER